MWSCVGGDQCGDVGAVSQVLEAECEALAGWDGVVRGLRDARAHQRKELLVLVWGDAVEVLEAVWVLLQRAE
jgi:hypothetical protein